MKLKKIGDELHITLEGADEIAAFKSRYAGNQLGSARIYNLSQSIAKQLVNFIEGKTECADHQPFYCEDGSRFCMNCGRPM